MRFYLARKAEFYDVTGQPLKLKTRRQYPYGEIINKLIQGREVFIPDIDKFMAHYIKRQLEKRIQQKLREEGIEARVTVSQEPAEWEVGGEVKEGYVFRLESVDVLSKEVNRDL